VRDQKMPPHPVPRSARNHPLPRGERDFAARLCVPNYSVTHTRHCEERNGSGPKWPAQWQAPRRSDPAQNFCLDCFAGARNDNPSSRRGFAFRTIALRTASLRGALATKQSSQIMAWVPAFAGMSGIWISHSFPRTRESSQHDKRWIASLALAMTIPFSRRGLRRPSYAKPRSSHSQTRHHRALPLAERRRFTRLCRWSMPAFRSHACRWKALRKRDFRMDCRIKVRQ